MAERWALCPNLAFSWRQIDGEWLVYEDLSGATHLIDAVSAAVLTCFETCANLSMTELRASLSADLGLDIPNEQAATAVQQYLALGLLLPANGPPAPHVAA